MTNITMLRTDKDKQCWLGW